MGKGKKSKSQRSESSIGLKDRLQSPAVKVASLMAVLGVLAIGAAYAWSKIGPRVMKDPRYLLTKENIDTPPQPEWIRGDVKAQVFEQAELGAISALDTQAAVKVNNAFALHTWVAQVEEVRKDNGPRITVSLRYRRPTAMVEVLDVAGERGLLPVDGEGVLLPPEDFSPTEALSYLRITVDYSHPVGVVGSPWGDERVAAAARIATKLLPVKDKLQLYRIRALPDQELRSDKSAQFDIVSRNGARVIWGRAPGDESTGEATASQKIERLKAVVAQHGPLDEQASFEIDLRDAASLSRRTASAAQTPPR